MVIEARGRSEAEKDNVGKEFLTRHWEQIVASDFFTIEVWTPTGLKRFVHSLPLWKSPTRTSGDRRNRKQGEWIMDGRKLGRKRHRLRSMGFLQGKAVSDS